MRLFLQGYSTTEIAKLHPSFGTIAHPLVVRARVDYDWDAQREQYITDLMSGARRSVEKSTLESLQLASDGMAVYHRLVGGKFRKFLETENPEDLGEWKDFSFGKYRQMIELLQTLMLQAQGAKGTPTRASMVVEDERVVEGEAPRISSDKPVTSSDATALLEAMLKGATK
jgi:hypothetical protein